MNDETQVITDIVPHRGGEIGLFEAGRPTAAGMVQSAADIATALAGVIAAQGLASTIQGRSFVKCEGWLSLARMNGCLPYEVSNAPDPDRPGVYVAVMQLRTIRDGQVIAQASAECGDPDEVDRNGNPVWSERPAYARRSMAATRATSKVCRLAFSWIMAMAGYEVTPAEEVPVDGFQNAPTKASIKQPQRASAPLTEPTTGEWTGLLTAVDETTGTNKKTGKPWIKFVAVAENGERYGTFSGIIGAALKDALDAHLTVEIHFTTGQYGHTIEGVSVTPF